MKKTALKISLYVGLIMVSWIIVGLSSAKMKQKKVIALNPVILDEENNHFLSIDDVNDIVREIQGRPIEECPVGEVNVNQIEGTLKSNPYVKDAEVYTKMDGMLMVELTLRKPLARVMYEDGSGFYLDKDMKKVDLSPVFSANTMLIRGLKWEPAVPRDSLFDPRLRKMGEFLEYVDRSEFLRSQVSEILVKDNGEVVIYPEVGDAVIEFGELTRIEEKFNNLELFYRRVLNKVGWEKYASISLKYKDQIVARK